MSATAGLSCVVVMRLAPEAGIYRLADSRYPAAGYSSTGVTPTRRRNQTDQRRNSRGAWVATAALLAVLVYVLSSGPARVIWPARGWRGGSTQFRSDFGVVRPRCPWEEPVASVYAPLSWLARHPFFRRPLHAYWTFFDRENFYSDEFIGPWPAIRYSRFGMAVRDALHRKQ